VRFLFGVPISDIHTPCRIHRLEKLAAIPLQSTSSFIDVEIPAKATFLTHVIGEVDVPPLEALPAQTARSDVRAIFRRPSFVRTLRPAEELEREKESADCPGGEDHQTDRDSA
jgi:hypothetical protein